MVKKIQQFQKLQSHVSDVLSPYEKQEVLAQFLLWEECLNVCKAKLYSKSKKEAFYSWRLHPYYSYACFVKDHKKFQYSAQVFDIDEDGVGDQILKLPLFEGDQYTAEYISGRRVLCFPGDNYVLGICPVDEARENEDFEVNVQNAIGCWWYRSKKHDQKAIDNAVMKMRKKAQRVTPPTFSSEQGPTETYDQPTEDVSPAGPVAVVLVDKPPEKEPKVKVLPYEVSEHHSSILNQEEDEEVTDNVNMVLLTADTTLVEEAGPETVPLSAWAISDSLGTPAWSGSFITDETSSESL